MAPPFKKQKSITMAAGLCNYVILVTAITYSISEICSSVNIDALSAHLAEQHVFEGARSFGVIQRGERLKGLEEVGIGRLVVLLLCMQRP